jgi:16S rRNA (guanine966-N2)-methyltransferase
MARERKKPERVVKPGLIGKDDTFGRSEVRVVAGSLKGRKVTCWVHPGMRPTPQLVREALFSILGNAVPGRAFYDIFAGSGICGIEAISRGATRATLLEKDAKHATEILKHVDRLGIAAKVTVLRADVYRWAERWVPPPDNLPVTLFASPPFPDLSPDKVAAFLKFVNDLLARAPNESVLALQTEEEFPFDQLPDPPAWDVRRYGRNYLAFYVKDVTPAEPAPVAGEAVSR